MVCMIFSMLHCLNDNLKGMITFSSNIPVLKKLGSNVNLTTLSISKYSHFYKEKIKLLIFLVYTLLCSCINSYIDNSYLLLAMALFYPTCFISIPVLINIRLVNDSKLSLLLIRSSLVSIFGFVAIYCSLNTNLINNFNPKDQDKVISSL